MRCDAGLTAAGFLSLTASSQILPKQNDGDPYPVWETGSTSASPPADISSNISIIVPSDITASSLSSPEASGMSRQQHMPTSILSMNNNSGNPGGDADRAYDSYTAQYHSNQNSYSAERYQPPPQYRLPSHLYHPHQQQQHQQQQQQQQQQLQLQQLKPNSQNQRLQPRVQHQPQYFPSAGGFTTGRTAISYESNGDQYLPQNDQLLPPNHAYYGSIPSAPVKPEPYTYPYNPTLYYSQNLGSTAPPNQAGTRVHRSPQRTPIQALAASQLGVNKPKRNARQRSRQPSRNPNFESGSMSMAFLAPGYVAGLPVLAPHVTLPPPGGYYWAVLNEQSMDVLKSDIENLRSGKNSSRRRYPMRTARQRSQKYISGSVTDDPLGNDQNNPGGGSTMPDWESGKPRITELPMDLKGNENDLHNIGHEEPLIDDDEDDYEDDGDDDDLDEDTKYIPRSSRKAGGSSRGSCSRKSKRSMRNSDGKHSRHSVKSEIDGPALLDQQAYIPIQMCQPPLCNVLPAYPQALDADPQPRTRKQSKYTPEQDKIILELKAQNRPWMEIAREAHCQNHLAARNRYQVLIGQQGGGSFIWNNDDCAALQDTLDEGERAKWLYMVHTLSGKLNFKFTIDMIHYKITSMFAENPLAFGVLRTKDPSSGGAPFDRHPLYGE